MALFTVKVSSEGSERGNYGFSQDVVTIGRDAKSDLPLNYDVVSRRHVELRLTDMGFTVTALTETSTTELNGTTLEPNAAVELENGDRVLLSGSILLQVTWDIEGEEPEPEPKAEPEPEPEAEPESEPKPEPKPEQRADAIPMVPASELEVAKQAIAKLERRNRKVRGDMSQALQAVDKAQAQLASAEEVAKGLLASLEESRRALGEFQARMRTKPRPTGRPPSRPRPS